MVMGACALRVRPLQLVAVVAAGATMWGNYALAFEEAAPHPSARAAAMAGVFVAQADDCSAIWYNPGGLQRADMIQRDATIEFGALPATDSTREYGSVNSLKFACGYWALDERQLGIGVAYTTLYRLGFDIAEYVHPLSLETFGVTDVTYRQASVLLSMPVNAQLAAGGTLDFVWTGIECSYEVCEEFGPLGLGGSIGAVLDVERTPSRRISVGGTWRTAAALRYADAPDSGVGAVLDQYMPDRPQSLAAGAHGQFALRNAVVNTNLTIERIWWAAASAARATAPDFTKFGLSGELLRPVSDRLSIAARAGATRASGSDRDANVYALGAGLMWDRHHAVDLALQWRAFTDSTTEETEHVSISYSWQR